MASRYADFKDYPRRRHPVDGGWLCRWCGAPLTGRRRSYCNDTCRAEVEVRCGWGVLHRVFKRDGGLCNRCGLEGYETLCIWCHKRETASWRAQRAGKSN